MVSKINKESVLSSLLWKLMERIGTQGVQFIVQIILARLLSPSEFGIIALVMVFINLAQVFVQSGFNTALIQKKNADEEDFSSVLYLSLFISVLLYIVLYLSSPFIAEFYESFELVQVLRILGLILIPGALNSVQNAYIAKNLLFKKLFKSSLGSVLISGLAGILCAYKGLGVWSLVIQQLINHTSITVILWFTVKWRPKLLFSWSKVKGLFSYGWKILASSLINVLYLDLRTLIIGRVYSSATLGFYNRGQQFPQIIVSNINGSIQSVMLPTLSAYQDDKQRVKEMMRRAIITSSFVIFPMMTGLIVVAEPMIEIILTEKWLPAVPFLQILSLSYALMPIQTANLEAINALGRSDIFLRLEIIKKIFGIIVLVITIPFGVYFIAWGQVVTSVISSFINAYPNISLLGYGLKEQITDITPAFLNSLLMGVLVFSVRFLNLTNWMELISQILLGIIIYLLIAVIMKLESFTYILNTVTLFVKKRGRN